MQPKIIAVDFDGTIVAHQYPVIGRPNPKAIKVLRRLMAEGHRLMLWTMRSGDELDEAVAYCLANGVTFEAGINENATQYTWTSSPKQYAHLYIDDAALGCPTLFDKATQRLWVNWNDVEGILQRIGYLT